MSRSQPGSCVQDSGVGAERLCGGEISVARFLLSEGAATRVSGAAPSSVGGAFLPDSSLGVAITNSMGGADSGTFENTKSTSTLCMEYTSFVNVEFGNVDVVVVVVGGLVLLCRSTRR